MSIASKVIGLLKARFGIERFATGLYLYSRATGVVNGFFCVASNGGYGFHNSGTIAAGSILASLQQTGVSGVIRVCQGTGGTGGTFVSAPLTPAQITSNQNNYAPGSGYMNYRLSTNADLYITGLSVGQQTALTGQMCHIYNVGSFNIVLKHDDANSTDLNRFLCVGSADITLAPNGIAFLMWESTSNRWRVGKLS